MPTKSILQTRYRQSYSLIQVQQHTLLTQLNTSYPMTQASIRVNILSKSQMGDAGMTKLRLEEMPSSPLLTQKVEHTTLSYITPCLLSASPLAYSQYTPQLKEVLWQHLVSLQAWLHTVTLRMIRQGKLYFLEDGPNSLSIPAYTTKTLEEWHIRPQGQRGHLQTSLLHSKYEYQYIYQWYQTMYNLSWKQNHAAAKISCWLSNPCYQTAWARTYWHNWTDRPNISWRLQIIYQLHWWILKHVVCLFSSLQWRGAYSPDAVYSRRCTD